jgi:hypothetical protein
MSIGLEVGLRLVRYHLQPRVVIRRGRTWVRLCGRGDGKGSRRGGVQEWQLAVWKELLAVMVCRAAAALVKMRGRSSTEER